MSHALHFGDCLDVMAALPAGSVDAVITDLPYGTTKCKWDVVIDFDPMWRELKRLTKPTAAIVLFAAQPFSSVLVVSNLGNFKYEWIWRKNTGGGFATAKYQPLRYHEHVLVFGAAATYFPEPSPRFSKRSENDCAKTPIRGGGKTTSQHVTMDIVWRQYEKTKGPESVLDFKSVPNSGGGKLHPTQKPVELLQYLVRTYTQPGQTVLDFTMGSGSTGVACKLEGRHFIGIENNAEYFNIAMQRIEEAPNAP